MATKKKPEPRSDEKVAPKALSLEEMKGQALDTLSRSLEAAEFISRGVLNQKCQMAELGTAGHEALAAGDNATFAAYARANSEIAESLVKMSEGLRNLSASAESAFRVANSLIAMIDAKKAAKRNEGAVMDHVLQTFPSPVEGEKGA